MAHITPRAPETKAMLDILTDASYADEVAMAKALLKAAYECFRQRDWFVVGLVPGVSGLPLAFYGLEPSETALAKEIQATLEVGGKAMVLPVFSIQALADRRTELEAVWGKSDLCGRCGHRESQHGFVKSGRGKTPTSDSHGNPIPPCSGKCQCDRFISQKEWKETEKAEAARLKEMRELAEAMEEEAYGDGSAVTTLAEDDDDLGGFEPPPDYYAA